MGAQELRGSSWGLAILRRLRSMMLRTIPRSIAFTALLITVSVTSVCCQETGNTAESSKAAEAYEHVTEDELERLFEKGDQDGDGLLHFMELAHLANNHAQNEAFTAAYKWLRKHDSFASVWTPAKHDKYAAEQGQKLHKDDPKGLDHHRRMADAKFQAADKNRDGHLDVHELPFYFFPEIDPQSLYAAVNVHIDSWDANKDGKIGVEELWGGMGTEQDKESFNALDKDQDGFLGFEELAFLERGHFIDLVDLREEHWDSFDKDGDNTTLTKDELFSARERLIKSGHAPHLKDMVKWTDEL